MTNMSDYDDFERHKVGCVRARHEAYFACPNSEPGAGSSGKDDDEGYGKTSLLRSSSPLDRRFPTAITNALFHYGCL